MAKNYWGTRLPMYWSDMSQRKRSLSLYMLEMVWTLEDIEFTPANAKNFLIIYLSISVRLDFLNESQPFCFSHRKNISQGNYNSNYFKRKKNQIYSLLELVFLCKFHFKCVCMTHDFIMHVNVYTIKLVSTTNVGKVF